MRCKMRLNFKEKVGDCITLHFAPVVDGSAENKEFFKYTPYGVVALATINEQGAAEKFSPGEEYYLDFTPVK